jgi:CRP/FNR family transcriptional regulator, cyclic AMP receptor protein
MTTQRAFKKGDTLFRQGDASDRVLRIVSGEIEVLREVEAASILLGHVREGEWLGEMGVVENRSRSATARATTDGIVEVLGAQQFLERVSGDPTLARDLILRLSIRLRKIENKIAGHLLSLAQEPSSSEAAAEVIDTIISAGATISLVAQSDALRAQMGADPVKVATLPYVVGRISAAHETPSARKPDLLLEDEEPFRLSRNHFMLVRQGNEVVIEDLGSTLGSVVNGQAIGHHFARDTAPLRRGDNHILAGGRGSPFEFLVSVAAA